MGLVQWHVYLIFLKFLLDGVENLLKRDGN